MGVLWKQAVLVRGLVAGSRPRKDELPSLAFAKASEPVARLADSERSALSQTGFADRVGPGPPRRTTVATPHLAARQEQMTDHHAIRDIIIDEEYGRRLFVEAIPEVASGKWQLLTCRPTEFRKHRRKSFVVYALEYMDGKHGSAHTCDVLVKIYGADRGQNGYDALRKLWCADFRSPGRFRVPQPHGYSAELGALVQENVSGILWADYLRGEAAPLRRASALAADWLVRLQQTAVAADVRAVEEELSNVRRFVDELTQAYPSNSSQLLSLAEQLATKLQAETFPLVPSHGDFHPKNLLLRDGAATGVDLDTFGLREAAFDVGYAIGQLLIMSYFRLGDLSRGAQAADALWQRYHEGGQASWHRVAAHVARTLLQSLHYELCTLNNGRVELLTLWPDLAESWLGSDGPQAA